MIGLSGIGGIGGIGAWKNAGVEKPIKPMEGMSDIEQDAKTEDDMIKSWASRVGDARAQVAH